MKKVVIRGPLVNASGYGIHSRQIYSYVESKGCDITAQITPWGICPYLLNEDYEDGLIGRILSKGKPVESKQDISFQVQLPNEWDSDAAEFNIGVTAGVESDKCNQQWIDCINKMDLVIVPSEHTKQTFISSGKVSTDIVVIPEYVQPGILNSDLPPMELEVSTKFNFLMFGTITGFNPESDRKNTFYGVKWLCEAFKNDPDVGVIIKTNLGRHTTIDREKSYEIIKKVVNEVRVGKYPKFYLSHGLMKESEISSFLKSENIKALVSFTRGEGYGLPLIEAAAVGLPVMATNWSGHLDFMNKIRFSSFDYDLREIDESRVDGVFIKGSKWAMPKEKDVIRKLKKIKKSYDIPKRWASEGKSVISESFNQASVFKIYDKFLDDILK